MGYIFNEATQCYELITEAKKRKKKVPPKKNGKKVKDEIDDGMEDDTEEYSESTFLRNVKLI